MLILFRKCSTARAAEVNLLCLKLLFTPKSSYWWCVAEALSQAEQSSRLSCTSLCAGIFLAAAFSPKWKVAGVQWYEVCCAGFQRSLSAASPHLFLLVFLIQAETLN